LTTKYNSQCINTLGRSNKRDQPGQYQHLVELIHMEQVPSSGNLNLGGPICKQLEHYMQRCVVNTSERAQIDTRTSIAAAGQLSQKNPRPLPYQATTEHKNSLCSYQFISRTPPKKPANNPSPHDHIEEFRRQVQKKEQSQQLE